MIAIRLPPSEEREAEQRVQERAPLRSTPRWRSGHSTAPLPPSRHRSCNPEDQGRLQGSRRHLPAVAARSTRDSQVSSLSSAALTASMKRTSFRMYIGFTGRLRGIVRISRTAECDILKCDPPPRGAVHLMPKVLHTASMSEIVQSARGLERILSSLDLLMAFAAPRLISRAENHMSPD